MRIFRKLQQLLDVDLETNAPADGDSLTYDSASSKWVPEAVSGGGGGGAPTDATYITQTANAGLDSEQALSALATGLVKVTNGTGVLSTATGGTDYANASHQHAGEDITSGTVADARIASTIARDSEVTSAISALSSVYQAKDTTLDTYAGIDPSANVQSVLGAADYASIRTLLGLVIGTNVQAYDADLTTYAGISPGADVQAILGAADYAAIRTLLGVSSPITVISDTTLGSDTATFDLQSIPSTYTHLRIMLLARATPAAAAQNPQLIFNNDSGSNYDYQNTVYNTTASIAEGVGVAFIRIGSIPAANAPSNVFSTSIIEFPFYRSAFHKTLQFQQQLKLASSTTNQFTDVGGGLWRNTAAITRITLALNAGSYLTGSRLILYGIA